MEPIHSRTLVVQRARVNRRNGGFTLVELIVTLAIMAIITTIAVTGQSTFNQSLLLTDTAYTVALSAREAQSLGLSSRKFAGIQNGGYGLHFSTGNPRSYIVFADVYNFPSPEPNPGGQFGCPIIATTTPEAKAGNCVYDGSTETYQTYGFTRGYTVSDFCGKVSGALTCSSGGALQSLDVTFLRPNTVSIITGVNQLGTQVSFSCAQITIAPPTGTNTQTVRISQLGEISIGQTCP
jgi:prepilin-type N-terminal cleavage/methylation domain-containing protein